MKLISQGAEAKIYLTDSKIIKDRIKKDYRIQEIDEKLRTFRTKREAKILEKLHKFGFVPKVLECDDKEKLVIEYIEGPKLRDVLDAIYFKNKLSALEICREIGKKIKIMHDNHIIHGDLTTSNMMLNSNILLDSREKSDNQDNNQVYFIDFGLSFVSQKVEDKAVDLHLLKQALESKHYKIWKECFDAVLEEYAKGEGHKDVISRLEKVEARGRNKAKGS
ncbi:Kae1-associated serine/threonine protein kinase [Candidatus Woesearchaeota archaeon]|nr:Kae1-associated serine/threonine protein kinase [Candidatus Woesearchaeota archaeon]